MITDPRVHSARATLEQRVRAVAARLRCCLVMEGAGRLTWGVGLPLLALTVLECTAGLPLLLRIPILPLVAVGLLFGAWRGLLRPLLQRTSPARAALLVESRRPDLRSRLISALQLYPHLGESERTGFDPAMVEATILYAQRSTEQDDFLALIDRRPARRHAAWAAATLGLWLIAFAVSPSGMAAALGRMGSAWLDVRDLARRMTGARLEIAAFDQPAYLRGSDVTVRAVQTGFRTARIDLFLRAKEAPDWSRRSLDISADGTAAFVVTNCQDSFECYAAAGRIQSAPVIVIVTERPRLVKLSVEYDLPAYVRRAPVVQPRSDGNLKALYGSSVVLTVEANKPLKSARLATSFLEQAEPLGVGGRFAQGALRLDLPQWRADPRPTIEETYTLRLTDEYGFENEDADRAYPVVVVKDVGPELEFVGLPPGADAREPHILEKQADGISLAVRGRDDYGITRVVLHYRIESLESNAEKSSGTRAFPLGLPRTELSQLGLARLSQFGVEVGDRIVFWAEAEDAYDLDPDAGPHVARTRTYRIAVVTEEQLFKDIVYRDDWSAHWYDGLKVASLARRSPPPRLAPESEPAARVAARRLEAVPVADGLRGRDRLAVRSYFESLSGD